MTGYSYWPLNKRSLSDEKIRSIAKAGRAAPKGSKLATYQAIAREYHCSASTVARIVNGIVLPKECLPHPL
jgi:DNA invertase Pin-like site-specific DNA recombinase